jgi:4-amino-4-deoxy-L-arabinose transferase-like glycosyltransferase
MPASPSPPARTSPRRGWVLGLALALHLVSGGWLLSSKGVGQYFYDERFTLENVRRVALQGHPIPDWYFWYAPLSYLPQATAMLAVDRLADAAGSARLATLQPTGEPTRLGIRLARSFGIVFGALTLIALHRAVRRLWDDRGADFAVVALAASPWFTRGNAEFKPDALLVLFCVTLFVPLLRYVLDGDARGRRVAAIVAGAAAAAKLNGVLAVVPLGLACWREPTWPRRIRVTLETAAITVVSFLVLNPFPGGALHYLRRVDQQWTVREEDLGFLAMLATMLGKLFKSTYLGPLFGVAAVAGLLLALASLRAGTNAPERRAGRTLFLLYPAVYLIFLCASTRYPKENNLLPALPFAAALAGVALARLATGAERAAPFLARALLPAAALLGAATLARYVVIETTGQYVDAQVVELRRTLGGGAGRVVAWWGGERAAHELANSGWGGRPPLILPLDAALVGDSERLARIDCVGGYGEPPEELARPLAGRFELRRYGGGLRGSRLVQRTPTPWHGCRPWRRSGEPLRLDFARGDDGWYVATVPAVLPPYDAFTLGGRLRGQDEPLEIEIAGRPFAAPPPAGSARQRWLLVGSERATDRIAGAELRVRSRSKVVPSLELQFWSGPDSTPSAPSDPGSAAEDATAAEEAGQSR